MSRVGRILREGMVGKPYESAYAHKYLFNGRVKRWQIGQQ